MPSGSAAPRRPRGLGDHARLGRRQPAGSARASVRGLASATTACPAGDSGRPVEAVVERASELGRDHRAERGDASSPATRAIALLTPEAIPALCSSASASTVAVSGATVADSPSEKTSSAGSRSVK